MATILSRPFPILFVVISALFLSACGINTIPTYEERAKAAWSDVLNQYQRRADLIPNLVETVKGYASQEEKVLTAGRRGARQGDADDARRPTSSPIRRNSSSIQELQGQLGAALGRLIAITENYPDLKSNQNFLALQSQLEGTENRIAVSRRDYIDAVRALQHRAEDLPRPALGDVPLHRQQADGDLHRRGREDRDPRGQVRLTWATFPRSSLPLKGGGQGGGRLNDQIASTFSTTFAASHSGVLSSMSDFPKLKLRDGTSIPQIGLGVWQVDPDITARVVSDGIKAGYRLIDTAEGYNNEEGVGEAIAAASVPRSELFITSKLRNGGHARDLALKNFDETMQKLGIDEIDLFLIHWPLPSRGKYVEAWKTLIELKQQGRIKSIGVSNFNQDHLERIIAETGETPVDQPDRAASALPAARQARLSRPPRHQDPELEPARQRPFAEGRDARRDRQEASEVGGAGDHPLAAS